MRQAFTVCLTSHPRSVLHLDLVKSIAAHYRTCHHYDMQLSVYPLPSLRESKRGLRSRVNRPILHQSCRRHPH
jgi:hypothetical protein